MNANHPSFDAPNPGCRGCVATLISAVVTLVVVAVGIIAVVVAS